MNEDIKKIFNNHYVTIFSGLAFLALILSILKFSSVNISFPGLQEILYSFSWGIFLFLSIMLLVSATLAHFKKFELMFLPIVLWLLVTTAIVRTANIPQLKDVTTGNYTLGPDLDPFLYLRGATEIVQGTAGQIDQFRYAPLHMTPSYFTTNLMSWAIVWLYKFLSAFKETTVTYVAIIAPVIFFIISTIGFLLFTKTLSSFKFSKEKSWIIALIATSLYVVLPQMLHRTVAGIPEIESLGMIWFWFAFLFILLAWKSKDTKKQIVFGVLAGLLTGLMSWTWGGYRYIYLGITLSSLLMFLFEKEKRKNWLIFSSWFIPAIILEIIRFKNVITAVSSLSDTAFALLLFITLIVDYLLLNTKLKEKLKLERIKIPDSIKNLIITVILILIFAIIFSKGSIIETVRGIIEGLLYPFGQARVGLTVAENQAPYFTDVLGAFGNLFWLFFFGVIILFYEATKHFDKKNKLILNSAFIIFITSFIFTRISPTSQIMNGETFLSQILYFGGLLIFAIVLFRMFLLAHIKKDEKILKDFKEIDFSYLLIISLSFFMIISMRGAIRLFFIISPFLALVAAFLPIKLFEIRKESKDSLAKVIFLIAGIVVIILMILAFTSSSSATVYEARATIPSDYTQQWQYAMQWVRDNTPIGSIFVHWWDYGYWVQTIGERPTVTDGGHYIGYWNHLIARYLLTTQNPDAALSLMKTYNASYLLIDSTDLGKYPAYSKIGGNGEFDTFSIIPAGPLDSSQTKEIGNSTTRVYPLGGYVDEDINLNIQGKEIFIPGPTYNNIGTPSYKAYVGGVILNITKSEISPPTIIYLYNNQQINLPARYLYYDNKMYDFGVGVNAVVQMIPQISSTSSGSMSVDRMGAVIYLSPKVSKSAFAQLYLLNNAFGEYPTITLAHSEADVIVKGAKQQGIDIGEFIYYGGFRGPVKIWKVNYPSNIKTNEEFLRTSGQYGEFDNLSFT